MTTPIEVVNAGKAIVCAVQALADLAKGAVKAEVARKIEIATRDIQNQVYELYSDLMAEKARGLDIHARNVALEAELREAEEKLAKAKSRESDLARYRLVEVGDGFFAYALASECAGSEPAHWACPRCMQDGVKSILRATLREFDEDGAITYFRCPRCQLSESVAGRVGPRFA